MRICRASLTLLAATSFCFLCAAADTTGTTVSNYTFASDVQAYVDVAQDICDAAASLKDNDWRSARDLYQEGSNSASTDGNAATLQEWARDADSFVYRDYDRDNWMDEDILEGLDGDDDEYNTDEERRQVVLSTLQSNVLVAQLFKALDRASNEVSAANTDAQTGAPHYVDAAAALFYNPSCAEYSIAEVANKAAAAFGTLAAGPDGNCTAATNLAAASAFNAMLAAAQSSDESAFDTAYDELQRQIVIIFMQSTLDYSKQLSDLINDGRRQEADVMEIQAEAAFYAIAPIVEAADDESEDTIDDALDDANSQVYDQVQRGFDRAMDDLRVFESDLGALGAESKCNSGSTASEESSTSPK